MVTGCAGFVGSHLSEALLARGHEVIGVDAFIPYYPRELKARNLSGLMNHPLFRFNELDLRNSVPAALAEGCDVIFHLAAMAGLMMSWNDLKLYSSCNILATQNLLEAARSCSVPQFIHVSTSSVYGKNATGTEMSPTTPFSPYGITKLAAENLCHAYAENFRVPITILRYFSVYGPRQRPDMAYNILICALAGQQTFKMFGTGEQTRSNTYVADCVEATILAFERRERALGQTFNIGGGEIISLNRVIALLEDMTGKSLRIERLPERPGDQQNTSANIGKARNLLGYAPKISIREGLEAQVAWQLR